LVPLYPETYAMTFPRGGIVRLRARALVPLCPETYAMTFPGVGRTRFAHPNFHRPILIESFITAMRDRARVTHLSFQSTLD